MSDDTAERLGAELRYRTFRAARTHGGLCANCGRVLAEDEAVWLERRQVSGRPRDALRVPVAIECVSPEFLARTEGQAPEPCVGCGRGVYYGKTNSRRHQALCSSRCVARMAAARRHAVKMGEGAGAVGDDVRVLPIVDTAVPDLQHPPLVSVDASDRPDVADVLRVILTDGEGYAETEWHLLDERRHILLEVHIERPVPCDFDLIFDAEFEAHRAMLQAAAALSSIAITTLSFARGSVVTPFVIPCNPEHLAELLEPFS
jgi:hypothetical protein